jgi:tetratricopeptide (TPR) repeat protein
LRLVAKVCVPLALAHASVRVQAQEGNTGAADSGATGADATSALTPPPRAALKHYEKGRALYLAGKYREAAVELEAAIALDPDSPNLVYNLAHVYELLGDIDLAIRHYRHYREVLRDPEEIARVDSTLQRLRGARHQVVDPPVAPPAPSAAPERPQRGVADAAFWTVTTFALGGLVTGGVLGGMALRADKEAQDFIIQEPGDDEKREGLIDKANRLALGSDISLLAGAVLGTTSILLFALRTKPAKSVAAPQARWNVDLGPQGAFLSYRRQL